MSSDHASTTRCRSVVPHARLPCSTRSHQMVHTFGDTLDSFGACTTTCELPYKDTTTTRYNRIVYHKQVRQCTIMKPTRCSSSGCSHKARISQSVFTTERSKWYIKCAHATTNLIHYRLASILMITSGSSLESQLTGTHPAILPRQ